METKDFTAGGKPEVSEKILKSLDYPEAKLIAEYLMIQKRLGQLAEGDQAYLKQIKRGKIYGQVITNGAVTGVVHIIHQIWHKFVQDLPYGKELRSLFTALPIWLCVVLIFLVWSCVCWGITCVYMTMDIFLKHYLKMIYIPPIKNSRTIHTF